MAETTAIEWAHATWNPFIGCHKISAGCKNCYMFRDMIWRGRNPNVVVRSKTTFDAPLKWARSGGVKGGTRIFTCSLSDWFIEEADEWRADAWEIIRQTPQYIYMILTKRPERIMAETMPGDWGSGWGNVWLGVSAENQVMADKRIPILLSVPAKTRFVSAEPLLGPIDMTKYLHCESCLVPSVCWCSDTKIDWVITGGESDKSNPRPCDLNWVRQIRNDCLANGTAYFHKQHGGSKKVNGTWGGNVLDGAIWHEFPDTIAIKHAELQPELMR